MRRCFGGLNDRRSGQRKIFRLSSHVNGPTYNDTPSAVRRFVFVFVFLSLENSGTFHLVTEVLDQKTELTVSDDHLIIISQ